MGEKNLGKHEVPTISYDAYTDDFAETNFKRTQ